MLVLRRVPVQLVGRDISWLMVRSIVWRDDSLADRCADGSWHEPCMVLLMNYRLCYCIMHYHRLSVCHSLASLMPLTMIVITLRVGHLL